MSAPSAPRVQRAPRRSGPRPGGTPRQAVPAAPADVTARRAARQAAAQQAAPAERATLATVGSHPLLSTYLILGSTAALLSIGLVMVLSSSAVEQMAAGDPVLGVFESQATFAAVGVVLLLVVSRMRVRWLELLAWPALGLAVVLQALTLVPGFSLEKNGNKAWIFLPGVGAMQPAEVAKLALVLWLAAVLARKQPLLGSARHVVVPALFPGAAVVVGLVMYGEDLGTALVIMALVVVSLYLAGATARLLVPMLLGGAVLMGLYLMYGPAYRVTRLTSAYTTCTDIQGQCFQIVQGLRALGSGGLAGVGPGASRGAWVIPESHNDFIFAVLGEELGLFGTLLVLALVATLGFAAMRIVVRHESPFAKIAAGGIAAWIVTQSLVNIGVVIKVLPVIGVPLPLISAGGSALLTTLVAIGVLLAFARTEPGAAEALAARRSVARRSLAVVGGAFGRRRTPARPGRTSRRSSRVRA